MTRSLSLKRETVAELTTEDLVHVRGGARGLSEAGGGGACTSIRGCYSGDIACTVNCPLTFNTCSC